MATSVELVTRLFQVRPLTYPLSLDILVTHVQRTPCEEADRDIPALDNSSTPTPWAHDRIGIGAMVGSMLNAKGRRAYTLILEDGELVQLSQVDTSASIAPSSPAMNSSGITIPLHRNAQKPPQHSAGNGNSSLIGRKEVAQLLGCHPDTLSRDRKKLAAAGLVGKRLAGSSIRWRRDDVMAYAERIGLTGKRAPGRPRKHF